MAGHGVVYMTLDHIAADAERRAHDPDTLRQYRAAWHQLVDATITAGAARRRLTANAEDLLRREDQRRELRERGSS